MHMGMSFYFVVGVAFLLLARLQELFLSMGQKWNRILNIVFILFPVLMFLDFLFTFLGLLIPVMGRVGMYAPVGIQNEEKMNCKNGRESCLFLNLSGFLFHFLFSYFYFILRRTFCDGIYLVFYLFSLILRDIVVAVVASLPIAFLVLLLTPLLYQPPAFSQLIKVLSFIFISSLLLSAFVFPYTKDTPKRIWLQHSTNFDTNISEIAVSGWDPIPVYDALLFGIFLFTSPPPPPPMLLLANDIKKWH